MALAHQRRFAEAVESCTRAIELNRSWPKAWAQRGAAHRSQGDLQRARTDLERSLELVVALEKAFGIKIQSHEIDPEVFSSVARLSTFIDDRRAVEGSSA